MITKGLDCSQKADSLFSFLTFSYMQIISKYEKAYYTPLSVSGSPSPCTHNLSIVVSKLETVVFVALCPCGPLVCLAPTWHR